jgi:hypothetical protein
MIIYSHAPPFQDIGLYDFNRQHWTRSQRKVFIGEKLKSQGVCTTRGSLFLQRLGTTSHPPMRNSYQAPIMSTKFFQLSF